ncbi:GNAT family N-acetyltransferase [Fulvivirga sediminis]|uniref:GNAT family N-acetyltransferase n=1 Tax=Fulvivirga sediminis TaxID=2803949 RepID=A0A937F705_9BACT|nr:GNAT family N-acetyltransferase [Fulvivirga sediminis]MBL3657531.1 GNAT family N-acetyltransferase [Fulvivirga sediminis]
MDIQIEQASLEEIIAISKNIPEFENPYQLTDYHKRLDRVKYLALKALVNGQAVGFKLGYDLGHQIFYSWFGGVLPNYRRYGVAKKLADTQEEWVKKHNFHFIRVKTRNHFKPMLIFALKSGFSIINIEKKEKTEEHRILLEKALI